MLNGFVLNQQEEEMKNLKKPSPLKKYNGSILAYHDECERPCCKEGVDVRVGLSSSTSPSVSVTTNGNNVQVRASTPIPHVPGCVVTVSKTYTPSTSTSSPSPSRNRYQDAVPHRDSYYDPNNKYHN